MQAATFVATMKTMTEPELRAAVRRYQMASARLFVARRPGPALSARAIADRHRAELRARRAAS